jgi:hypothetical protein
MWNLFEPHTYSSADLVKFADSDEHTLRARSRERVDTTFKQRSKLLMPSDVVVLFLPYHYLVAATPRSPPSPSCLHRDISTQSILSTSDVRDRNDRDISIFKLISLRNLPAGYTDWRLDTYQSTALVPVRFYLR